MSYPAPQFCLATGTEVFEVAGYGEHLTVVPAFKGTNAGKRGYKIYVAVREARVHYVGCTCTRMSSRLRLGQLRTTEPKNGYHGYKWLPGKEDSLQVVQLYVFHLTGLPHPAPDKDAGKANQSVAERIEAELVYAVRAATGQWPLSQHEIHFHNLAEDQPLADLTTGIARQLYQKLNLPHPLLPLNS